VHVHGLDFGTGSLRMLEALPHVGSVISGDDPERVIRLLRTLRAELDGRAPRYAAANAASIAEYRELAGRPNEPRILLVIDGYPAFRDEWESTLGRMAWYQVFRDILTDGRQLGMHVVLTADRPGAVPTNVSSAIQRRVVLRLADEAGYMSLDVPTDILGPSSAPGRAIVDGLESQIAVLGGSAVVADQAAAIGRLAESMRRAGVVAAPAVGSLPTEYSQADLPASVDGEPVLGVSELDLGPYPFAASGVMILTGPPASGRSNALDVLSRAHQRADADARQYYIGNARSALAADPRWVGAATTVDDAGALARSLAEAMADPDTEGRIVVIVENIADFLQTPAEAGLTELVKAVKRSDHALIAESETAAWSSSWGLFSELKGVRRGLLLQPDYTEGEFILKTPLPRSSRAEFPVGRGVYIARGKHLRVQLPLAMSEADAPTPSAAQTTDPTSAASAAASAGDDAGGQEPVLVNG
jgi:S-DNA-T family DNA segregation ATPase FtsK/SpoIIIE